MGNDVYLQSDTWGHNENSPALFICACGLVWGEHATAWQQDATALFALKSPRTHLELLNLISAVLFVLRWALKWWASWLLPIPPIHNKGQPDEDRGCQSPIRVPFIMADLEALTALNYWLRSRSTKCHTLLSTSPWNQMLNILWTFSVWAVFLYCIRTVHILLYNCTILLDLLHEIVATKKCYENLNNVHAVTSKIILR